jgi:hypothetical protein
MSQFKSRLNNTSNFDNSELMSLVASTNDVYGNRLEMVVDILAEDIGAFNREGEIDLQEETKAEDNARAILHHPCQEIASIEGS